MGTRVKRETSKFITVDTGYWPRNANQTHLSTGVMREAPHGCSVLGCWRSDGFILMPTRVLAYFALCRHRADLARPAPVGQPRMLLTIFVISYSLRTRREDRAFLKVDARFQ